MNDNRGATLTSRVVWGSIVTALALPACMLDQPADGDVDYGEQASALTGTVNPVDCGFSDGRTCKSTQTLANNVSDTVKWDPCLGGAFTWTATVDFEPTYDRACVGGKASAGSGGGCSAGTMLAGATTTTGSSAGAVTLGIATDGSVQSAGITSLTATCNEPLFVGVFRASPAGASQVVALGLDWNAFVDKWTTLSGQGKRLSKIEAWYDSDGTTRFDGVYTPGAGPYGFNAGMTIAQLKSQQVANAANGMEISDLDALQTASGVVYIGVWRAGTRTQKIFDGLVSDFWPWSGPYTQQGYQPTSVEAYYDAAGNHRYTVVMTLTPGQSGWYAAVGIEYGPFIKEWQKYRDQGWRLEQMETHVKNGVRYYDGFFLPGSGNEDFVPGTRALEFQQALARDTTSGLEVVDLDRAKLERTAADAQKEERLARGEYPVVSPVWMSQAESYFWTKWGQDSVGYTVALMKDGRLLGASSVGYAKSPTDGGVRLTADAQWDYLSDSKWITSLAAAKVAEEYGVDLDTTLLVPAIAGKLGLVVPVTSDKTDFWHITLWHAMTHTSNLQDGGCDNGPALANWDKPLNQALQNMGGSGPGHYSYSGFDACMLRVWVEVKTGMPYERYVDTHLFRPNGIHDLDCKKDPEKVEVLQYVAPGDSAPGRSEPETYCAAAGWKGTPLQMLQILQGVRVPGRFLGAGMLDRMRNGTTAGGDEWTFYQSAFDVDSNGTPDAYGYSMTGGRVGMRTHIAQFPADPNNSSFTTGAYTSGVDAIFFTNAGPGNGFWIQWSSMQADPNP